MQVQDRPKLANNVASVFGVSPRKRVLFVDYDADITALIEILLGTRGLDVTIANSCREARKSIGSESFDLFLLDSRLPDGSGIDLCREIHELYPEKPVLFFSGVAFESERCRSVRAGAAEYLVKPNDLYRLGGVVERYAFGNGRSTEARK